ncbi:hypothetical protein EYV94_02765 [Puteibacter caeruleilacunae]|nr:hypothetical protein EYV94_02765 [Puteibacter caeruleilacunae]
MRRYLFSMTLLIALTCISKLQAQDTTPNIVIILADDMGYGDPTCYNPKSKIPTPNIDKLANEGMMFTDAHSASAVCTPTRYSILTGRYSWRTRLKKGVLWAWDKPLIKQERLTLPEMLKEKGYQTAAIGKWHLGWEWATNDTTPAIENDGANVDYNKEITGGPLAHGFDYYYGDDVPNFPPYTFIENEKVTKTPTVDKPNSMYGRKGKMADGWKLEDVMPQITAKSVDYINKASKSKKPFFLYFALTAPHCPIAPLTKFKGKSEAGPYGDFVYEIDWCIGQVRQALKDNGVDENTIIIFTSDNGSPAKNGKNMGGPNESVIADYGHNPSADFRGIKSDVWEGGHRVPFIVKWTNKVKGGEKTSELSCSMDLMATIAEIVDYKLPDDASEDGHSLLKTLSGTKNSGRELLVNHSGGGVFAIRKDNWKLIMSNKSGGFSDFAHRDGYGIETPGQLYNLKDDPSEQNNLYNSHPKKVEELKRALDKIRNNN